MDASVSQVVRGIPAVSELLKAPLCKEMCDEFGQGTTKVVLRQMLRDMRGDLLGGRLSSVPDTADLMAMLRRCLLRVSRPVGRKAINATGILLHTGLGRAPLCAEAIEALAGCTGYSILQTDPVTGTRSTRDAKVERMLAELTGCEAATVVNNNAGATMLVLNTLAEGREVIISRGQLIEIGGSFRMPDVMAKSSAILREVGTTNQTHVHDYDRAISDRTAAILHVHTSNYRIRGFADTPPIEELCELGREHNIPVIDDVGSGAIVPLESFGLPNEPLVSDSIRAGACAVCFSGDKLICGPQSGIICGTRDVIDRIRKNPLARMLRVCKMTLCALEATLVHFINGDNYKKAIPLYRMLMRSPDELEDQARTLAEIVGEIPGLSVSIIDETSYVGSGSAPDQGIRTKALCVVPGNALLTRLSPGDLSRRLRMCIPSVFCRLNDGRVLLDMRTVWSDDLGQVAEALRKACGPEE